MEFVRRALRPGCPRASSLGRRRTEVSTASPETHRLPEKTSSLKRLASSRRWADTLARALMASPVESRRCSLLPLVFVRTTSAASCVKRWRSAWGMCSCHPCPLLFSLPSFMPEFDTSSTQNTASAAGRQERCGVTPHAKFSMCVNMSLVSPQRGWRSGARLCRYLWSRSDENALTTQPCAAGNISGWKRG